MNKIPFSCSVVGFEDLLDLLIDPVALLEAMVDFDTVEVLLLTSRIPLPNIKKISMFGNCSLFMKNAFISHCIKTVLTEVKSLNIV